MEGSKILVVSVPAKKKS